MRTVQSDVRPTCCWDCCIVALSLALVLAAEQWNTKDNTARHTATWPTSFSAPGRRCLGDGRRQHHGLSTCTRITSRLFCYARYPK